MTVIVFSRDRAMQLDAFLRSFKQWVVPAQHVVVIYKATTERHEQAYSVVFQRAQSFTTAYEQGSSFKADLLQFLPPSGMVAFFVDDQVFVRPWVVAEIDGLSLRLAPHLTRDYNSNDAFQPVPKLTPLSNGLLTWRWREGVLSWGYPLSVDGNLYDLAEFRPMVEAIDFHSPNTFEAGLQAYTPRFLHKKAYCYPQSKVVNIPWNRVQEDWVNRSGHEPRTNVDELLFYWERGMRISLHPLAGLVNESVHQECPITLESWR